MIKKASSLRHPQSHQLHGDNLENMNARPSPLQAMQPEQPDHSTRQFHQDYPMLQTGHQNASQMHFPQQGPFPRLSEKQGNRSSFSDHDSLWQIGQNAYAYRTLDPVMREENLRIYRELVGITTSPSTASHDQRISSISYLCLRDPAKNIGYYQRIVDSELKASIWYTTSTWSINVLLGLQIAIAAVLTALGVTTGPNRGLAISILAACNTATATLLTYLKAKGQPLRALQYRDAMRQLKEQIEYTERLFELGITGGGQLNPAKAASEVKQSYDKVQADQERSEEASEAAQLGAHPAAQAGSPVETKPGPKQAVGNVGGTGTSNAPSGDPHDTAARLV